MATQVTGRKRVPNREKLSAEDDALSQIAREAEARLAAKRAARAEARDIRMKELERQQKEGNHTDLYGSTSSLPSARLQNGRPSDYNGFLGSSSRASSRASSARASPVDSLADVEEKYRKAMVSNAQLDNEKTNLIYQVDTLRETLMEMEEILCETRRECEEKTRAHERELHAHTLLIGQFDEVKETLRESQELLTKAQESHGKQEDYIKEISELQETLEWKDKRIRALERQKEYSDIFHDEREALRDEVYRLRDALKKHGIVLGCEVTANGEVAYGAVDGHADAEPASRLIQDSHTPTMSGESMLDRTPEQHTIPKKQDHGMKITRDLCGTNQVLEKVRKMFAQEEIRLRKLVEERESLLEQVQKFKAIAEKKQKNGTEKVGSTDNDDLQNGLDPHILDLQRDSNRQISDLKFKLVKSEQEVTALEQNILRLEGQVTRYKTAADAAEKVEDELKVEKRKLQRELRSALDRVDELEATNSHLTKRLEKMKANRSALLAQQ
ncbi:Leucine-rich repeat flightless-interacting protein 2 [Triplophysa tibetana]|uniref:Leucine-rich repeat flightless-interacting protein 2 n=1 Tax=Triplophysa tibetana TaxID=1572043 RepID=A0A5A9NVH5_9TELE|nr:Leucine-rich repeat flightless-interacting protein 2 [Triplophysa tibetana]